MSETEVKIIDQVEENAKIDLEDLMRKYDTEARFRALTGWQGQLVALLAVAMSCFHFYTSGFGLLLAQMQGAVHLAFTLALVFLLYSMILSLPRSVSQVRCISCSFLTISLRGPVCRPRRTL